MVDVLLTMNEAFCIAGGEVSCAESPNLFKWRGAQVISEKKHD
jgi:hypothetical protein